MSSMSLMLNYESAVITTTAKQVSLLILARGSMARGLPAGL